MLTAMFQVVSPRCEAGKAAGEITLWDCIPNSNRPTTQYPFKAPFSGWSRYPGRFRLRSEGVPASSSSARASALRPAMPGLTLQESSRSYIRLKPQ